MDEATGGKAAAGGVDGSAARAGDAASSAASGGTTGGAGSPARASGGAPAGGGAGPGLGGRKGAAGGAPRSGGEGGAEGGESGSGGVRSGAGEAGQGSGGEPACSAPDGCACDAEQASCEALVGSLLHRYPFDGEGTGVTDVRGSLHGVVLGVDAELSGDGVLTLAGGGDGVDEPKQYVALPAGCLDGLTDVTLELWFGIEGGGAPWQHLFDFGQPSDETTGTAFWFSPQAQSAGTGPSRVAFGTSGYDDDVVVSGPVLALGEHHVAVVVDSVAEMLTLYLDGAFVGAQALASPLSALVTEGCWLGRSNFAGDPYFAGTLEEFRIYGVALDAAAIGFSHAAGQSPPHL